MHGDYYIPHTKKELLIWIRQRYFSQGQCVAGLERLTVKQLYAIFYRLLEQVKEGSLC